MLNIKQFLDMSGRGARRLLEFVALLFVVAAIGFLVQFFERLLPENVVSLPAPWGPMIRVPSSLCLQTLAALWLLATLQRGYPLRTLFRVQLRTTVAVAAAAVASITLAALLIDFPAIRSNGFHPINPSIHPEVWTATLAAMTLGAFFEELFHRALLQPLIGRLFNSELAGMLGAALIFTLMHPPKDAVLVVPGALLLGIVFWRTRSLVCTTALHLSMNVTVDLLKGRSLMVSPLLSAEEFAPMRPAIGLALVLLAIAFECWHRRASRRATLAPPNERAAIAAAESTSG